MSEEKISLEGMDTINLVLEDDSQETVGVLGIFKLSEDAEKEYIALMNEEGIVYLYEYIEVEEEDQLELDIIESDEEYEIVAKVFEELFLDDEEDIEE